MSDIGVELDNRKFFECLKDLCNGAEVSPDLKQNYIGNKDFIVEIQDHIKEHCFLCDQFDYPALAVIEMAEAYAKYHE